MMLNWKIFLKENYNHSWNERNNCLKKKFVFKDFEQAFDFIKKVAILAQKYNHHPKWTNEYNLVEIELSTHDKGNKITHKDIKLAKEIDKLIKPIISY